MSSTSQQTQSGQAQGQAQPTQQPQQAAVASTSSATATANGSSTNNIIAALSTAFKTSTGENLQHDKIAQLLLQNMDQISELAKQGRLSQAQIEQVRAQIISPLRDCKTYDSYYFFSFYNPLLLDN